MVLNGVAKTYAMTGWRVGWMIGPADVIKAATNLQSHVTSNVANVAQRAALAAVPGDLDRGPGHARRVRPSPQGDPPKLADIPGVTCLEPEGAFYAFPTSRACSAATSAASAASSTLELAELVLDEAKVAFVPGEAFGAPATPGSRSRWATTTSARASTVWRRSSPVAPEPDRMIRR